MSLPLYDGGVASGLLNGLLFGYVLENAGFGSPRKLTAQFRFSDWSVFKVMFTAIIVAAIGLYGATEIGLLQANGVFIPTTFLWATLTGGAPGRSMAARTADVQSPSSGRRTVSTAKPCASARVCHSNTGEE